MISKIKKTFSLAGIPKGKKREVNRTGPYYIHESPVSRIDDSTLLFFPLSPASVASAEPAAAPPSRSLCFSLANERDDTTFFPRAIVFPFAESKQGKDGTGGRCEDRKRIGPDAQIVIPHLATQPRGFSGCR